MYRSALWLLVINPPHHYIRVIHIILLVILQGLLCHHVLFSKMPFTEHQLMLILDWYFSFLCLRWLQKALVDRVLLLNSCSCEMRLHGSDMYLITLALKPISTPVTSVIFLFLILLLVILLKTLYIYRQ